MKMSHSLEDGCKTLKKFWGGENFKRFYKCWVLMKTEN